ncbi:dihydroxy-acid dehydratase [Agrilactobacillus composti DSM 18527 = JCM 14202]|nr:dihydroxy-acid dehydratase [Agrilactobacillus composti DSM 18527 = JCM 14202]
MADQQPKDLRIRSHVYDGMVKSPNRALMRATGMQDADFKKPIVGVVSTWSENTPCNMHLRGFGDIAEKSVTEAGVGRYNLARSPCPMGLPWGPQGCAFPCHPGM